MDQPRSVIQDIDRELIGEVRYGIGLWESVISQFSAPKFAMYVLGDTRPKINVEYGQVYPRFSQADDFENGVNYV